MTMLVLTLLIAAAVVYHTMPAASGVSFFFGPLVYAVSVWLGVLGAFLTALLAIELLAFIVGGGMRLILP